MNILLQEKGFEWRTEKSEYVDLIGWREDGKQKVIKKTCIELGKKEKRDKNERENHLKLELEKLIRCPRQSVAKRINELKQELKRIEDEKIN